MSFQRGASLQAFACIFALSAPAHAADQDTQFWLGVSARVPISHHVGVTLEASPRIRSAAAQSDQLLFRSTLDTKVKSWLNVGLGAAFVASDGPNEFRLFQQVTLTTGPLALRSQLEERWFDGAPRVQLRARARAQLTLTVDSRDRALASAERFYVLQAAQPADRPKTEQWRFKLEWRHKLSPRLEFGLGYLLAIAPREGASSSVSHVPQLNLAFAF